MSASEQKVASQFRLARPTGRARRYLYIATFSRVVVALMTLVAIQRPDLRPDDPRLLPPLFTAMFAILVLNYLLGFLPAATRYLRLFGIVDSVMIGYAVWITDGTWSPFVALFGLVIAFHGVLYGFSGLITGALPSVIALIAAAIGAPGMVLGGALGVEVGVLLGLAGLTSFAGQGERQSRQGLREQAAKEATRARQFRALYETSATISGEVEAEGLLATAVDLTYEFARELWGEDVVCAVNLIDAESQEIVIEKVAGIDPKYPAGTRIPLAALGGVIERNLARREALLLDEEGMETLKRFYDLPPTATGFGAPIIVDEEPIGVLTVRSDSGAIPTREELDLLQIVANHIAAALDRVRILNEERRRRTEATALFELAREINTETEVNQVLNRITEATMDLAGVDFCGIGLVSADSITMDKTAWTYRGIRPSPEQVEALPPIPMSDFSQAFDERQPMEIQGFDAFSENTRAGGELLGLISTLIFPILSREGPLGLLFLSYKKQTSFKLYQWQVGEALAGLAAVAIENIRNYQAEKDAATELRELDRLKTEMVSTASHELRSPLTSIAGYARTLLRPGVQFTEEEKHEFITVIDQQARQLARLIDELLTVSRIEEGRLALSLGRIDLAGLMLEVLAAAKMRTESHTFELEFPDDLPHVVVDENKVTEIITNLIDNAIKYSPGGGRIKIGANIIDQELHMWVSDQGIGVPEEELSKVFEKYYQIEGRPKTGTGLGLYIVRELAHAHNGRVWVESAEAGGTSFHIAIPQRRATDRLPV